MYLLILSFQICQGHSLFLVWCSTVFIYLFVFLFFVYVYPDTVLIFWVPIVLNPSKPEVEIALRMRWPKVNGEIRGNLLSFFQKSDIKTSLIRYYIVLKDSAMIRSFSVHYVCKNSYNESLMCSRWLFHVCWWLLFKKYI